MSKLPLFIATALTAISTFAAHYTLDLTTGATALDAQAPILRKTTVALASECKPPASIAVGDTIDLALFDDIRFALKIVSAPPAGIAGQSFIARDENGSASAIVKVAENRARISVDDFMNRRQYTVRCKDGQATIFERDNSQEEPGECGTCGGEIEMPQPVEDMTATTTVAPSTKSRKLLGASGNEFPLAEQKSVVDILVAFDKGAVARSSALGYDTIEDFADYAVNKMNEVLVNSQLADQFSYRLAGVTEIDDTWTKVDGTLLNNVRLREGKLAKLGQLREKFGADTITLLIDKTQGNTTGIGYGYYPISSFSNPGAFDRGNYACNICDINTVYSRYTMSHETGHNMGCDHSNRQGKDSGPGRYSDSCGYHFTDANNVRRSTVMAYTYTSDDDYYYDPIPYFSTPDMEPEEYGCALGEEGVNNNRGTLLQTHADIAGLREHVLPYDWDVRVWEGENEIIEGRFCKYTSYGNHTLTLTCANSEATIYYTLDGSDPTSTSSSIKAGYTINVNLEDEKTLKICAVVNDVAQSIRTLTLREGIEWTGESGQNGDGRWSTDQNILAWDSGERPFEKWATVIFPENADNASPAITVMGEIAPWATAFTAINTAYTFNKNDENSLLKLRDANFAPSGDVTFNLPVQLDATTFTNLTGNVLAFNAPFGQTVDATSGYCTNMIGIGPSGTLTVAPGSGKTQTINKLNNVGWYSNTSTFRVGEGKVVFNGTINGGAGVIGRTKLEVGDGGELVFNMGGGTGHEMNQTSLTVEKGGVVRYNDMEHLCRALYLNGGTIYAKRLDLMSNPGVYVNDDSSIENNVGGYILIRNSDSEINVSDGKTLTLNVGTQTDNRSDTSGWGIIKRGSGTIVANGELKHSGVTDIEGGSLEVGYSAGSTIYGLGWIVADGSTLKVKSGCTLKTPTLTLDSGATICVPAASSAPIVATNNVSVARVRFLLTGAENLTTGATYPLLKGNDGISGSKDAKTGRLPKLASGLKWELEVADNTLYAKVVEKSALELAVPFASNDPDLVLAVPDDAKLGADGGAVIDKSPIVVDGLSTKAVSIAMKFDVPATAPSSYAAICSWKLGDYVIYCIRETDGKLNCRWGDKTKTLQTTANQTNSVAITSGEHLLQIGYYSNGDNGGTRVLLDGKVAYVASGLKFSSEDVSEVAFGASAEDSPRYPYAGLIVKEVAVLDVLSSEPAPRMTASGGDIAYSLNVPGVIPRVFPLTPSGALALDETVVEATFSETPGEASISVVASFPADSTNTICGIWLDLQNGYFPCALQAEYDDNGKFYLRYNDNSLSSFPAERLTEEIADVTKPHIYTLTFKDGEGAKFYQDGVALLKSAYPYVDYQPCKVVSPVTFGCGPYHAWRSSRWHDYPYPAKDFNLYASHIALGTSDRTVSEDAVMASMATDEEDDDPKPPETPATVDVLVAYDNGAQAYVANKGVTLAEFAATQIERMNDVLATNRLDRYYSYRLAGVCKVDGVYDNIDTAPGLIAAGEGPAVSLRAARELYGADTVTLLVDVTGNTLGNSSPLNSPNDVASQHECAFSVCSIRAVDTGKQHTMIHENAHNMGCGHARAQSIINSPFEYGRGYYFKDGNVTRHTIMAYGGDNDASWYFSTTSKEFGFDLGDATNNNARVLKETCGEVAKWREGAAIALAGVDVQDVAFATSALYPWSVEDGTIRSFNQTNYQYQCTTPLKATITGPKVLSFKHKSYFGGESVAGNNYSHFDVLLDDSPVLTQTECTNSWIEAQLVIPEGTHEVTFVFSQRFAMNNSKDYKDGTPEADDAVWLKDIVLTDAAVSTELNIPAGTSVNLSNVGSFIETITGEGTLVCDASLPTKGYGLTSDTWRGTVAFSNFNDENTAKDFQVEKYGNANSKVQFTNCKIPFLKNNNATFAGTVVLDGDSALTIKDGYSDNYNIFGALEGSGTMSFLDKPMQWYVFNTATNFTGSINVQHGVYNGTVIQGRRIVFGTTSDLPTQSASITVKSGAEAAIGANATWYAYHGVEIAGTLIVKGENSTLSCNSGGKMGVKFTDGATIRFDAAGAKLNCPTNLTFASGTVKIAFADGVTPANNSVIATWPNTSTINGRFKLVGAVTNDYEIATNATGLIFKEKPNDRLDFSGYSYLVEDDVRQWLLDKKPDYYEWEYEMYSWQEYLLDSIGSSNGYTYLQNFLLGYEPEGFKYGEGVQKFSANIEIVNGEVKITTTEGSIRDGCGLVKWLYRKDKMGDEWKKEKMDGKTITIGAGGSEFYKISIEIEE